MISFDVTGKTALVTGSTQGIGFALAAALHQYGARVFVHGGTSAEKCAAAAAKIPGAVPVLEPLGVPGCADRLYAQTGDVDILILNASLQIRRHWDEIPPEEYDRVLDVNLRSSLELIQKYEPHMEQNGWGRIVCVGSVQEYKPHRDMLMYAASKAGLMSMVKNLAKQLAGKGITVNNLCPGVIATPRNSEALADPVYSRQVYAGIPMGFAGDAADCAGAALLLCSDAGRYITGTEILVDGGMAL